ncbi:Phosphoglycolate phosphatase [compost metagenome]
MNMPRVILFDLYGTLLDFNQRAFIKNLAQALDLTARAVAVKLFGDYTCRPFASDADMVSDLLLSLGVEADEATHAHCLSILDAHLAKVTLIDEAPQVLAFLKACGFRIGLVSNAASAFKSPVERLGLSSYFDCMIYSCDIGSCKPDRATYRAALQHFDALPEACMFIGDSWRNDYLAPRSLGMQAVWIGKTADPSVRHIERLGDLAWYSLQQHRLLLNRGDTLVFDNQHYVLEQLDTLPHPLAGKYNIVAKGMLISNDHRASRSVYFKRFSLAGSAYLEQLAYSIYRSLDATRCIAEVIDCAEPVLITSEILGAPWHPRDAPLLAEQMGFHLALAYILAHTDIRPRNLLVQSDEQGLRVELIDMEHCFFAAALETDDLGDVLQPATFDALSHEGYLCRIKHSPLAVATLRRVVSLFTRDYDHTARNHFTRGWVRGFENAREIRMTIADRLRRAVRGSPSPIIGTRAYRRALIPIDIDLLLLRASENPTEKLDEILDRRPDTFDYEHTVTMGDTNAMGNCYFLKYFELQGHVRELWLTQHVARYEQVLDRYILSTRSAHCDYRVPFFLYDTVIVKLYCTELQRVSVTLHFEFYCKGSDRLHATGEQKVVCKDKARKTCRMPPELMTAFTQLARR